MYDRVQKKVNIREAVTNMAVTLVNSSLQIESLLCSDMSDLLLLTTTLGTELNFIEVVSGRSVEAEISSMFIAGIKTSLGSPTAFASYCATHSVSAIIRFYDAFQLWQLSKKIGLAAALNDLMWNYYAFGMDLRKFVDHYNISGADCPGADSDFDCIVRYFSKTQKVDYHDLADGARGVLRYVDSTYSNLINHAKQIPSIPTFYNIPDGVNPTDITFSWSKSVCENGSGISYNLEIHKENQVVFKADDYEGSLLDGTSYTLPITLDPNTTYYWAVFPRSYDGIWNLDVVDWSGFTTGADTSNSQPHALFTLSPNTGCPDTIFEANAGSSSDPDGDPLEYCWNWGESAGFSSWSTSPQASHQYQNPGNYTATLHVRDESAESYYSKLIIVSPANTPPVKITNATPCKGACRLPIDTDINWSNGGGALSYDIYFGKDPDPVNNSKSSQEASTFDPGILEYNTTYCWRINPVNAHGTTIGDIRSFTTCEPPPWLKYHYWDFDTDGTEGWSARNAEDQGIYNQEYWIVNPVFDPASKSGIISASGLTAIHTDMYDTIQVRAGVKNTFISSLEAHLMIDGQWMSPISLDYVSGEQVSNSQCIYRGNIPHSGQLQQIRIDFVTGSESVDDRIYIDRVELLNSVSDSTNSISGYVRDASGRGISDATLVFSHGAGAVATDVSGYYNRSVTQGWSGTVTPYLTLYSFNPSSTAYNNVNSAQIQNYTGAPPDNRISEQFYSGIGGVNDGFVFNHGFESYADIQSADSANEVSNPDHTTTLIIGQDRAVSGEYYVYRASIPFDTSNLPDDCTITGARLYLYGYDADYSDTDFNLEIVQSGQTSPASLSLSDYGCFGTSSGGSFHSSGWQGDNGAVIISLNAAGLNWINKTGLTALGLRSSRDISQSPPQGHEFINIWSSESGSPYKPFLIVDYSTGYDNEVSGTIRLPDPDNPAQNLQQTDLTQIAIEVGYPADIAENGLYLTETSVRPSQGVPYSTTSYLLKNTNPGDKIIYAWFEDQAGNISTVPATAGFTLIRSDVLSGKVVDLSTGNPIPGVTVSTSIGGSAQTDPNGNYNLENMFPGVYDITFAKTGYAALTVSNFFISATRNNILNVELTTPGLLNITTSTLPAAETNETYNPKVRISGGTYPYIYAIASGILPPGLFLDSDYGNITGIPTSAGSYTFSISVTDSQNAYAKKEFTIQATAKLKIISDSPLPRGTRGADYFENIKATGGDLPHTFAKVNGVLPPGLSVSTNGVFSGTPARAGSYDFTVQVTDASARTAEKSFHIEIVDPLIISTIRLNDGIVGKPYNQSLSASGGCGSNRWAVYSGILPAGLSLDAQSGVLSGTPAEAAYGTVVFSVSDFSVSDREARTACKDFILQVTDLLEIITISAPDGLTGRSYSETIRVSGGIEPFAFGYTGQLPPGLSLNSTTGIISGIPVTPESANVSITVTDSTYPTAQAVTRNLNICTTSQLTILTSAALPKGKKGIEINPVILQAGGGTSPYTWAITGGYLPEGISLNARTGELTGAPADKGGFVFTIQITDADKDTTEKEFFCHISGDLNIVAGAIPDGARGASYNFILEAEGGLSPYNYRIKSGALPTGLFLNTATGTIYGRPANLETRSFTIEISDNDSPAQKADKTYTIEVLDDLYIFTTGIPDGRLDNAYTATIRALLGKPPYKWRLQSGLLPPGLMLSSSPTTAAIEGKPIEIGSYLFTLEVSDSGTPVIYVTKEYTVKIHGDLIIETTGIKNAGRGASYSDNIVAANGKPPYAWKITEGSLPVGLSLNSTSGHISGITTMVSGQSSIFKVRVTDSGNPPDFDEKEFVIHASPDDVIAGDIDGSKTVDLKDVIMVLQITNGLIPASPVYKGCDVNGNAMIGVEEAVYILQVIAGLRSSES
ncbi:MAG: putative Ig domain-containing protein [Thermodesulfobacteriota bacterium]|nr:putative Ig domain-containing protein [Thermodesulfobacteriota bacterium]